MSELLLRSILAGSKVPDVRWFETIGSTNDEALTWAAMGAKEYSLVVANHQSAGRGRMSRKWITRPDASLAFSLVLHPTKEEVERIGLFSALGALALCKTLENCCQLNSEIKWPNDVLIMGKKAAGILAESNWQGEQIQHVVLGIGINVIPAAIPDESELIFPATSVESASQNPVDRFLLLQNLIEQIIFWRQTLLKERFLEAYNNLLAYKDKRVTIQHGSGESIAGTVRGVGSSGDLKLETENGKLHLIQVGDVHLRL